MAVKDHLLSVCVLSASALAVTQATAVDFGAVTGAMDTVQRAQGAATAGQQLLDTGRSATDSARNLWQQRQQQPIYDPAATSIAPMRAPDSNAALSDDQGGPKRLLAVLNDTWHQSARQGKAVIALMDQGPYLVQRQTAHVAPINAQWLATPKGDSTGVFIDLPTEPEGTTYDFSTGKVRPGGRGVRIYTLSVHAEVPLRQGRRGLDGIEQHAMLRASSLRTSWPTQATDTMEVTGGKLLVWSSDATQRFPSGFGPDGRLFTPDDPMVTLPKGYTVVTLDPQGFRFDRGREIALTFHPVIPAEEIDYSRLSPGDAAAALIALIREQHPRASQAVSDWTAFGQEYASRYRTAAERRDVEGQAQLLFEIGLRLRDGLYQVQLPDGRPWPTRPDRGFGSNTLARGIINQPMSRIWMKDDGNLVVTGVAPGSAAAMAGIAPGTVIRTIEGDTVSRYLDRAANASLRTNLEARKQDGLTLDLPGHAQLSLRVQLPSGGEQELRLGSTAPSLPAAVKEPALSAFQLRSSSGASYGYIAIDSFKDGNRGLLANWEASVAAAAQARVQGLILDLRAVQGDSHQLVPHMLASLYTPDRPLKLAAASQRAFDSSTRLWRSRGSLGIPAALPIAASATGFSGPLVVITDPDCSGPCEMFAGWIQSSRRGDVVSTHPTAGALGQTSRVLMPGGITIKLPLFEETGPMSEMRPQAEGKSIAPRLRVPVNTEFIASVQAGGDPVLDAAVRELDRNGPTWFRR